MNSLLFEEASEELSRYQLLHRIANLEAQKEELHRSNSNLKRARTAFVEHIARLEQQLEAALAATRGAA
jgi:cell division protein FtsB